MLGILLLLTSVVGGLANAVLSRNGLIGASGIVYMLIMLTPLTSDRPPQGSKKNHKANHIPITFILLFLLYTGKEVSYILADDGVSHLGHLVGGFVGATVGLMMRVQRTR